MKQSNRITAFIYALGLLGSSWLTLNHIRFGDWSCDLSKDQGSGCGQGIFPGYVLAQSTAPEEALIQFNQPPLGDRGSPPGRREGGASRGDSGAVDTETNLTALVPASQIASSASSLASYESVLSLTTEPHPSFWFYVPSQLAKNSELEFVLQDESGNTLYQVEFIADFDEEKNSPGIIQFSLPETSSPLVAEELYQWYLLVHRDSSSADDPPYVMGWIMRTHISQNLQTQLEDKSMLEKASLYAANGIWQDALTILGELYREEPQDLIVRQNWMSLLASANLNEVSEKPLIECCTFTQVGM